MDFTGYLDKDDKGQRVIRTPGVDFGPKGLLLIHQAGNYLVTKQPGHNAWVSRGQSGYYATQYHLLKMHSPYRNRDWGRTFHQFQELAEIEPGKKWRGEVAALVAMANEAAKKEASRAAR